MIRRPLALLLPIALAGPGVASADEPAIVSVSAPNRVAVGSAAEIRLAFRAPRGDVVAVVVTEEDAVPASAGGRTRQREVGVVARAFGHESGELTLPISFLTPGRKRITLTLLTDERVASEPFVVELDAVP